MPARRLVRLSSGAAGILILAVLAGCGENALPGPPTSKADPKPAERVLRAYLNHDRCDLLADRIAETIAPDPSDGRRLCAQGLLPVDAYVERGTYKVTSREIIDGQGLFTIALRDGGTRDYVLDKGGPDSFQISQLTDHTQVGFGEPLLLQARLDASAPLVTARIVADTISRIPESELGPDEYVSNTSKYYKVHVTVTSRAKQIETVGSSSFTLAESHGVKIADSQIPYSNVGGLLPPQVKPGQTVEGYLFFVVPNVRAAKPAQLIFTLGSGVTGATLVWTTKRS